VPLLALEREPWRPWSTSSGVIGMTGIAFWWIGSTMPLGSVVMIENSAWSPMLGTFLVPRSPVETVGRQTSLVAADRLIGAGFSTDREEPSLNFSSGAWQKGGLGLGIH